MVLWRTQYMTALSDKWKQRIEELWRMTNYGSSTHQALTSLATEMQAEHEKEKQQWISSEVDAANLDADFHQKKHEKALEELHELRNQLVAKDAEIARLKEALKQDTK